MRERQTRRDSKSLAESELRQVNESHQGGLNNLCGQLVVARGPLVNLFWTLMGRIIGMTRFTKFGLTITNSIGKFLGGGLGYDK